MITRNGASVRAQTDPSSPTLTLQCSILYTGIRSTASVLYRIGDSRQMPNRFASAFRSAAPVGVGMAVLCCAIAVTRWSQIATSRSSIVVILVGLPLLVFLNYFVLAVAGYRVRSDGVVDAPRIVAWLVAAIVALLLAGGIVIMALLSG